MKLGRIGLCVTGLVVVLVPVVLAPERAGAAADNCTSGISSDFNGDGHTDTVVADPSATVSGQPGAGRVQVLYGDSDNRIGEGLRAVVAQGSGNVGGTPEAGDHFGLSMAVADIDCDDFTDLVVGTPDEDISGQVDSGYVQVVWGAAGGLGNGTASTQYTQSSFGRTIGAGDRFGFAVDALEDIGQGGTGAPDAFALAIGVPGGDIDAKDKAGWVAVSAAFDGGNTKFTVDQATPGVPSDPEVGDRFGYSVTLNQLTRSAPGESLVDLAVGSPYEDVGSVKDAGSVTVLRDLYDEVTGGGVLLTQDTAGVPGAAEANDRFGQVLDSSKVNTIGRLAVGIPLEDIGTRKDAGSVQTFYANNAATMTASPGLSQDTAGVTGAAETGDQFGWSVAYLPPGLGDSKLWLGVGAPGEDAGVADRGGVQFFPVGNPAGDVVYNQDVAGVPGASGAGDRFGATLSAVAGPTERIMIVGVPDDSSRATGMANVHPFDGTADRYWAPGVGGVASVGSVRFADALTSSGV